MGLLCSPLAYIQSLEFFINFLPPLFGFLEEEFLLVTNGSRHVMNKSETAGPQGSPDSAILLAVENEQELSMGSGQMLFKSY